MRYGNSFFVTNSLMESYLLVTDFETLGLQSDVNIDCVRIHDQHYHHRYHDHHFIHDDHRYHHRHLGSNLE